jgi:hypothetical protein
MKNKVKMVLAYFRALGGNFYTSITFEYNRIEDWDERFAEVYGNRRVKPPKVIIDIFEELFKLYKDRINYFNDYDSDEYWYLTVDVNPNENYIRFTSECEFVGASAREFKGDVDDYDIEDDLSSFERKYDLESDLVIEFKGKWDDSQITGILVDDKYVETTSNFNDTDAWNIVNKIMSKEFSKFWSSDDGYEGDIKISGSIVIGDINDIYREYGNTGMDIIITPDNVLEK